MIQLLIVDDERYIADSMKDDIDWGSIGIDTVHVAYDGTEALTVLEKQNIDVMIADIQMPDIDGLELTKMIKDRLLYTKVILFSGFDEFKYAQQAVNLKVFRYLTKPASDEEIVDAVKKALEEHKNEIDALYDFNEVKQEFERLLPSLQDKLLSDFILFGQFNPKNNLERWKSYHLENIVKQNGFLIYISANRWRDNTKNHQFKRVAIQQLLEKIILKDINGRLIWDNRDRWVCVINNENTESLNSWLKKSSKLAETCCSTALRNLGCQLTILYSDIVLFEDFDKSYRDLSKRSFRHGWQDKSVIDNQEMMKNNKYKPILNDNDFMTMKMLLSSFQKDRVLALLNDIINRLSDRKNTTQESIFEIWEFIISNLVRNSHMNKIPMTEWAGDDMIAFITSFQDSTPEQLRMHCSKVVNMYFTYISKEKHDNYNAIVKSAKNIINEYLCEGISLSELAERLYVHPNHLSRVFHNVEKINISQYIIRRKMELACKLLRKKDMLIYEISEYLGYSSVAHFNRLFKRELGITPKEYQKKQI